MVGHHLLTVLLLLVHQLNSNQVLSRGWKDFLEMRIIYEVNDPTGLPSPAADGIVISYESAKVADVPSGRGRK